MKARAESAEEKEPAPRRMATFDVTTIVTSSSCPAEGVGGLLFTTVYLKVFKKPTKQIKLNLSKLIGKVEGC
jgi:hypothetical protein